MFSSTAHKMLECVYPPALKFVLELNLMHANTLCVSCERTESAVE